MFILSRRDAIDLQREASYVDIVLSVSKRPGDIFWVEPVNDKLHVNDLKKLRVILERIRGELDSQGPRTSYSEERKAV